MVKLTVSVEGIRLSKGERQQVIVQFADDSSFILLGEEVIVKKLLALLALFARLLALSLSWINHMAIGTLGNL